MLDKFKAHMYWTEKRKAQLHPVPRMTMLHLKLGSEGPPSSSHHTGSCVAEGSLWSCPSSLSYWHACPEVNALETLGSVEASHRLPCLTRPLAPAGSPQSACLIPFPSPTTTVRDHLPRKSRLP